MTNPKYTVMAPEEAQHILAHLEQLQPGEFPEDEAMRAFQTISSMTATYDAVELNPLSNPPPQST